MERQRLTISPDRKNKLDTAFLAAFGNAPTRYFSAPGRTEIGGNHTDHQQGRVLAAAVDLDTLAAVRPNGSRIIRVLSEGYPLCQVELDRLEPVEAERNTTTALIRGVAAGFVKAGCPVEGFDACCTSAVLPGSGLSSSAAFEVLMGTVINHLFFDGRADAPQVAAIGQYAENVFFGKPCGLMDQMASAVGGLVTIDFYHKDAPEIRKLDFDFAACGHALCIIDTRASHADLTEEYAAIPAEMKQICAFFGQDVLSRVSRQDFYDHLAALRQSCSDRAIMRAMHFYEDNDRVPRQAAALEQGNFSEFLALVRESGHSSWVQLQNVTPAGSICRQEVALTLALCAHLLEGSGACRVHGGGFAGTVQAFVPLDRLEVFRSGVDRVLGEGACHVLSIRSQGGTEIFG